MKMLFKAQYKCALGVENMVPLRKYILVRTVAPIEGAVVQFKFLFCFMAAVLLLVKLYGNHVSSCKMSILILIPLLQNGQDSRKLYIKYLAHYQSRIRHSINGHSNDYTVIISNRRCCCHLTEVVTVELNDRVPGQQRPSAHLQMLSCLPRHLSSVVTVVSGSC